MSQLLASASVTRSTAPPSRKAGFQQVDLHHLHPLRWVEARLKRFVPDSFQRTDAVLLCNDDPIVGCRRKNGLASMHMKHHRCDQGTYLVIAMQSRSRAPQVSWPQDSS